MKNYIQDGDTITVTAPSNVTSGALVQVGRIRGVAVTTVLSGAAVELKTTGVFSIPKLGSEEFAVGAPVYVVLASNGVKTVTVADGTNNVLVGISLSVSGAVAGSIQVKLMPTASNQLATTVV